VTLQQPWKMQWISQSLGPAAASVLIGGQVLMAVPIFAAEQAPQEILNTRSEMVAAPGLTLTQQRVLADRGPDGRIVALALDEAGQIYMLDDLAQEVRVLSRQGSSVGTIDGAGEWRLPFGVAVARDTVLVLDAGHPPEPGTRTHTHVLHVTGLAPGVKGRGRLDRSLNPVPRVIGTEQGWALSGWINIDFPADPGQRLLFDSIYVENFKLPEASLERAFTARAAPFIADPVGIRRRPFQYFKPGLTVASDGRIYTVPEDTYAIELLGPDAVPRVRILAEVDRRPITDREHREYLDRTIRELRERLERNPNSEARSWRILAALEEGDRDGRVDHWPVTGTLIPSRNGYLLVERPDLSVDASGGEGGTVWDLFDGDGNIAGRLSVPGSISPVLLDYPLVYGYERTGEGPKVMQWRIEGR
jgi:hypothetical protein